MEDQGVLNKHLFSRSAGCIIELAKAAAQEYGQGHVGTEHLLLGIIREGTSTAAKMLCDRGVTEQKVKQVVDALTKERLHDTWILGRLPGTPHWRDVLTKAAEKAQGVGNWQIGSVHLLYALLSERNSTGLKALRTLGISVESLCKGLSSGRPFV